MGCFYRRRLISIRIYGSATATLFVALALEYALPALGPLHAWAAVAPRYGRPLLPAMIRVIMLWLAEEIPKRGVVRYKALADTQSYGELFRVDAKAEGLKVVLGGWYTGENPDPRSAAWYAVELSPESAPWAYQRGPAPGEPFRVIASLELLAVLVVS